MAQITLPKEIFAQQPILTSVVEYTSIVDSLSNKMVVTEITYHKFDDGSKIIKPLILWEGEAYDAIGQWTDEQAEARIIELLTS